MSGHTCPVCATYPAAVDRAIGHAGREHDAALGRIRRGEATERDLPSAPPERIAGGATWWADGAPWDVPAPVTA